MWQPRLSDARPARPLSSREERVEVKKRRLSSPGDSGSGRFVLAALFLLAVFVWAGYKVKTRSSIDEVAPNAIYNNIRTGRTVVMFGAEWCGWCKKLEPGLAREARERSEVRFFKVEANVPRAAKRFWEDFSIGGYPTLVVYRNGIETGRQVGYLPDVPLRKFLNDSLAR